MESVFAVLRKVTDLADGSERLLAKIIACIEKLSETLLTRGRSDRRICGIKAQFLIGQAVQLPEIIVSTSVSYTRMTNSLHSHGTMGSMQLSSANTDVRPSHGDYSIQVYLSHTNPCSS